jgi:3-oxoacyl-[acyl-carrier-protein] synthase-1
LQFGKKKWAFNAVQMKDVNVIAESIITPLGIGTDANFANLLRGEDGIKQQLKSTNTSLPYWAALLNLSEINDLFEEGNLKYTLFEKVCILAIKDAIKRCTISLENHKTIFILSTTKGNVDVLLSKEFPEKRAYLYESAKQIQHYFKLVHQPLVVSNACISGVVALNLASDLISNGVYETVVVCGADIVSEFTHSGFEAFKALSSQACKPFDAQRDGTSLGEGAGAIVLSSTQKGDFKLLAGASSNDANHISGPSRDGEGLFLAIQKTMNRCGKPKLDFISAHGTGTIYNDEMESKAFNLAGLEQVFVNSFKGFYGHTFGAAGIIESVVTLECMRQNTILSSKGYTSKSESINLNIPIKNHSQELVTCLKTASGFGGCNAAVLFQKNK